MAKHVLYGDITSTAKQPYLRQTHQHYNDMIDELTKAYGETIVSDPTKVTILWGCENTGTGTGIGQSAIISAGAVYYNGEIYQVPAFSTASIVNGIKGTFTTTYAGIDPILFSDSTTHNVHQIQRLVLSDAAAGLTADYANWKTIKSVWKTKILTVNDIFANDVDGVTLTGATKKQLDYNINYKDKTITINILVQGIDVSINSAISFKIRLPEELYISENYCNIGHFYNSYLTTTEATGTTKQTSTFMVTGGAYDNFLTISPSRESFLQFDTTGTNNLNFYGQITLPYLV